MRQYLDSSVTLLIGTPTHFILHTIVDASSKALLDHAFIVLGRGDSIQGGSRGIGILSFTLMIMGLKQIVVGVQNTQGVSKVMCKRVNILCLQKKMSPDMVLQQLQNRCNSHNYPLTFKFVSSPSSPGLNPIENVQLEMKGRVKATGGGCGKVKH